MYLVSFLSENIGPVREVSLTIMQYSVAPVLLYMPTAEQTVKIIVHSFLCFAGIYGYNGSQDYQLRTSQL